MRPAPGARNTTPRYYGWGKEIGKANAQLRQLRRPKPRCTGRMAQPGFLSARNASSASKTDTSGQNVLRKWRRGWLEKRKRPITKQAPRTARPGKSGQAAQRVISGRLVSPNKSQYGHLGPAALPATIILDVRYFANGFPRAWTGERFR